MYSRSFDPIEDHHRYANELGREAQMREAIAIEMHDFRSEAMDRIDRIVHPEYAEKFAKILAYAASEGLHEAEIIAKDLGLSQGHVLALDNDFEGFRSVYKNQSYEDYQTDRGMDMYLDRYV